jgi:hypothetical protein
MSRVVSKYFLSNIDTIDTREEITCNLFMIFIKTQRVYNYIALQFRLIFDEFPSSWCIIFIYNLFFS